MSVVTEEIGTAESVEILDSGPPPRHPGGGDEGDGEPRDPAPAFPVSKGRMGLWLLLTGITMLFAGFSSAYIVLRGLPSWQNVAVPSVLWVNTLVIMASSVAMEQTRRSMRRGQAGSAKLWIGATGALGLAFLVGQVVAWGRMVDAGVFLPSTLHSSFLYILTGTHAVHLVGGVGALAFVLIQTFRNRYTKQDHEPIALCATYWHFIDGLWVYLFLLFVLA